MKCNVYEDDFKDVNLDVNVDDEGIEAVYHTSYKYREGIF